MEAKNSIRPASESRRIWRMAGIVFLLAVVVRLAFLAWRGPELSPDSHDYLRLAQNLVAHARFSLAADSPFAPSVRWPPLYPAFIAALSWAGSLFSAGDRSDPGRYWVRYRLWHYCSWRARYCLSSGRSLPRLRMPSTPA